MTETYEVEADIDAPAARVWQALTDSRELEQWFCEHADVDLAAGRFDFWGRHTPHVPTADHGHGRVLEAEPERLLSIDWGGMTITFHLDGSTLRVVQDGAPERPTTGGHLPSHWWQFALGHLQSLLTTGQTGPRFDWSAPHHGGFSAVAAVDAPPATVWDGLVSGWLTPHNERRRPARNDYEDFGFDVGVVMGIKILDLDRPRRFSMEWIGDETTVLSYDLDTNGTGGTFVTIVQSGFDENEDLQGQAEGFFSGVLELAWRLAGAEVTIRRIRDGSHDMRLASERV